MAEELNAIGTESGWVKITAVVDSGAGDNVLPQKELPFIPLAPTARSKAGRGFCGPSGEPIKNFGQKRVDVRTTEGQARATTWQVANVRRPLMSVSKMTKAGNDVRFNDKTPHIHNLKTGEKTVMRKEGNIFVVDLWVRLPRTPGIDTTNGPVRMEIDHVAASKPGFTRQAP